MKTKTSDIVLIEKSNLLKKDLIPFGGEIQSFQTHSSNLKGSLSESSPQMVIMGVEDEVQKSKDLLTELRIVNPNIYWVLSGKNMSSGDLVDFMRLGACDFLNQPITETEFKSLMNRATEWKSRFHNSNEEKPHQVISLFSCKGGVGLTLIAANLAATLAKDANTRVLVVDFVLQHGNMAEFFDIYPQYTLLDLFENLDRTDKKLLESSITKHESGVYVLPCPKHPEDSESMSAEDIEKLIHLVKDSFDYVILDAGHELNTTSLGCLDNSDSVYVVTTPDLPSLCNAKVALETFKKLGYPAEKSDLILNRVGIKGEIEKNLIHKNLGHEIFHRIHNDTELAMDAINQGKTLESLSKKAPIVKSFQEFTRKIKSALESGA